VTTPGLEELEWVGSLVDLLYRLLAGGIVVAGDVMLTVANIDLVRVRLLALLTSVPPRDSDKARRPT
jgi:hypothetical protein